MLCRIALFDMLYACKCLSQCGDGVYCEAWKVSGSHTDSSFREYDVLLCCYAYFESLAYHIIVCTLRLYSHHGADLRVTCAYHMRTVCLAYDSARGVHTIVGLFRIANVLGTRTHTYVV